MRAGRDLRWDDDDYVSVQEQAPACRYVLPELGRGGLTVHSAFNNGSPTVAGSLPPFAEIRSVNVAEGRFYNWDDQKYSRRVAFLGSNVKKQLFASREAVGQTITINNLPYTVIGVMQSKDQNSSYDGWDIDKVFIPFSSMVRDFPEKPPSTPHNIDRLIVTPQSVQHHEACKGEVRRALGRLHGFDPTDKEAAPIWDTTAGAKAFSLLIERMKLVVSTVALVSVFLRDIGAMNAAMNCALANRQILAHIPHAGRRQGLRLVPRNVASSSTIERVGSRSGRHSRAAGIEAAGAEETAQFAHAAKIVPSRGAAVDDKRLVLDAQRPERFHLLAD